MNDTDILGQTEHISAIFARIMENILTLDVPGVSEEITPAQFQALRHIARHGSTTVGHLAEGLCVSQPATTMLIDRMERRGLVERRPGRTDRRQAEVTLTSRAEELLHTIENQRMERLSAVLEQMSPEDRRRFVQSLEAFIGAALKHGRNAGEICLKCGRAHNPNCIVSQWEAEARGNDE